MSAMLDYGPCDTGSANGTPPARVFSTGATRDSDADKLDYEGFLSPVVLERYARYMNVHRRQPDGSLRDSDNWTRGIPRRQYVKSLFRHFMDVLLLTRDWPEKATTLSLEDALCAVLFNAMGLLHEALIGRSV
jgi:hypothetical protein